MYGARMSAREQFEKGQDVIVAFWGEVDEAAVVVDKTRGGATRVKLASGATMLVGNQIIRKA